MTLDLEIEQTWTIGGLNLRTADRVFLVHDGLSAGITCVAVRLRDHETGRCDRGHHPVFCFEDDLSESPRDWTSGVLWRAARCFDLRGGTEAEEVCRRRHVRSLLYFGRARPATPEEERGFIGLRSRPSPAPSYDEYRQNVVDSAASRLTNERNMPWPRRADLPQDQRLQPDAVYRELSRQIEAKKAAPDWRETLLADKGTRDGVWWERTHGRGSKRDLARRFWAEAYEKPNKKGRPERKPFGLIESFATWLSGVERPVFEAAAAWANQHVGRTREETVTASRLAACVVELERDLELDPGPRLDSLVENVRTARYYRETEGAIHHPMD